MHDLVILGATPGGITAAIAAARLSKTSVIVERTTYIGGLPANGLGATDIATRGATGGLFLEFVQRIKAHYISKYGMDSPQVRDCDDGYHFEPSVAETVFHTWLGEYPHIKVLTGRQFDFEPQHVLLEGSRITSIRVLNRDTGKEERIPGKVFLDCTYEGDLIAAAGVPFFVGREGQNIYNEVGAGRVYKLWYGPECDGSTHSGDNSVQAYNYRLCATDNPDNRVEITRPTNYNRQDYVSLVNDVRSGLHTGVDVLDLTPEQVEDNVKRAERNEPPKPNKLGGIRRLLSNVTIPNGKVDGNNQHFAFISTDLPEENWPYPTSSWAWRDRFAQRLREYTEGLFYFAQNDEALPQWFRDECKQWGWAKDEYVDNGHFPRQIYVREGRRMKGKHIFTANDVLAPDSKPSVLHVNPETERQAYANGNVGVNLEPPRVHHTTVTASHYALDSHAVRKREPGRVHLDGFFSYRCKPYTVPYEVMVPDSPITNLLAPVPVSASHVGFSTIRMEPCWMALGQAGGVAAALCLQDNVFVGDVNIQKLQEVLLDEGAVLVYDKQLWKDGFSPEDRRNMQRQLLEQCARNGDSQ